MMKQRLLIVSLMMLAGLAQGVYAAQESAKKTAAGVQAQLKEFEGKSALQVLGLNQGATQAEIRSAYRDLQLEWHPDKNPGLDVDAVVKHVNSAYESLTKGGRFKQLGGQSQRPIPQQREQKQASEKPQSKPQAQKAAGQQQPNARYQRALQEAEKIAKGFEDELNKLNAEQLELFATYYVYGIFKAMFKVDPAHVSFRYKEVGLHGFFKDPELEEFWHLNHKAANNAYLLLQKNDRELGSRMLSHVLFNLKHDYVHKFTPMPDWNEKSLTMLQRDQYEFAALKNLYNVLYKKTGSQMRMASGPANGMLLPSNQMIANHPWTLGGFALNAAFTSPFDRNLLAAYFYELFMKVEDWSALTDDEYARASADLQTQIISEAQDKKAIVRALRSALELIKPYAQNLKEKMKQQTLRNVLRSLYGTVFPAADVEIPFGAYQGRKFVNPVLIGVEAQAENKEGQEGAAKK